MMKWAPSSGLSCARLSEDRKTIGAASKSESSKEHFNCVKYFCRLNLCDISYAGVFLVH